MDDDEELFRRSMRSLGVEPLDCEDEPDEAEPPLKAPAPPRKGRPRRPEPFVPDAEDELFVASMESVQVAADKDGAAARSPSPPRIRELKAAKSRAVEPEAALDLHGFTADEAVERLRRFVAASSAEGLKSVIVVTGKGLRSERGVPVLKQAVARWLRRTGKEWVRAYSEAPRALGGSGAFILYLR